MSGTTEEMEAAWAEAREWERSIREDQYPHLFTDYLPGRRFEVGKGWRPLIEKMLGSMDYLLSAAQGQGLFGIHVFQIKEKFGGLRVYTGNTSPEGDVYFDLLVQSIVNTAEEEAASACEVCGAYATSQGEGWIQTLCKEHAPKKKEDGVS